MYCFVALCLKCAANIDAPLEYICGNYFYGHDARCPGQGSEHVVQLTGAKYLHTTVYGSSFHMLLSLYGFF